jgi:hypothetical protein
MADLYLVERGKGPAWDHARGRREQAGWDEHAAFMDGLVEEGFVVLGGPVGEGDGETTLLGQCGCAPRLDVASRRSAIPRTV